MSKNEQYNLVEIGKRLRILRAYQRRTQLQMAKELGISLSHYSKLEIGIGGMSHGLALALCRQFDLPENWLLYGIGEMPDLSNVKLPVRVSNRGGNSSGNASAKDCISDEQLESMMEIILQENFQSLAKQVAQTMNIPLTRAMVLLAKEKIRHPIIAANDVHIERC